MKKFYLLIGIMSAVVIGAVVYGFSITGSPFKRQAIKMDQRRMSDFTSLSYNIQSYYSKNQKLPDKLSDITNSALYSNDPKTKQPYEYKKVTAISYTLCANFELDSKDSQDKNNYYDDYYSPLLFFTTPVAHAQFSVPEETGPKTHKKGYDCITYTIPRSYIKTTYMIPATVYANISGGKNLADYIIVQLNNGYSKATIRSLSIQSGWAEKDVDLLLNAAVPNEIY
jgi:hypothetical protein